MDTGAVADLSTPAKRMTLQASASPRSMSRFPAGVAAAVALPLLVAAIYAFTGDARLTLGAACAPLGLLLCLRFPFPITALFVVFSFYRVHDAFQFLQPLKIPLALGALMVTSLVLHVFVLRSTRPFLSVELSRLLVLFVLVLIGALFAQDRGIAWDFITSTYAKTLVMTFALAWLIGREADFKFVVRALVVGGLLIAGVAIHNKLNGIGLVEGTRVTIGLIPTIPGREDAVVQTSSLADPNDLALVLLFPLAVALSLVVQRAGRLDALLGALTTVATLLAIVFTQSRGGLFGVLAVFGVIGIRYIKSRAALVALALAAAIGLAAAMGLGQRVSGGAAEIEKSGVDESAMGRIYAWQTAINMAVRRPLTGVGIDNFSSSYFIFTDHWRKENKAVHSTWFEVLGEMGFPGFFVFLMLVAATFRTAQQALRRLTRVEASPLLQAVALSLVAGMAGFCAAGTFLTQAFTLQLYVMIGLTAGLGRYVVINLPVRPATATQADDAETATTHPRIRGLYAPLSR